MNTESNIIWGLDPKNQEQQEFFNTLFDDKDFISEVEEIIDGIKPNLKFYQSPEGLTLLRKILDRFSRYKILDAKLSDGLNTEKGVINNFIDRVDAITIAPASGDDLSFIENLQGRGKDVFVMGAMSFPGTVGELILGKYEFQLAKIRQNLNNGVAGIVMGATAYNPDVEPEIEKIQSKLKEGNDEYACLREYGEDQLKEGIKLRNKLFAQVYQELETRESTKILVPGFGRQGGKVDNFREGVNNTQNPHYFNAGSDTIKGLGDPGSDVTKQEVITRLTQSQSTFKAILDVN